MHQQRELIGEYAKRDTITITMFLWLPWDVEEPVGSNSEDSPILLSMGEPIIPVVGHANPVSLVELVMEHTPWAGRGRIVQRQQASSQNREAIKIDIMQHPSVCRL